MSNVKKTSFTLTTSWFNKFFECLTAYAFLRDLAHTYLPIDHSIFFSEISYFGSLFTGWNSLIIIGIIFFCFWWNKKEEKGMAGSDTLHEWIRSVIFYYATFLLLQYGFAKIYNDQFHHTYYRDDMLARNLTGFAVAWNFFNYSFYFTFIVGVLQVTGGVLLLFRRTRLAGSLMLLPIMLNILLINIFYVISPSALINAILIIVALLYIIWLQRKKLMVLLFVRSADKVASRTRYIKAVLRIAVIVFSFMLGYPYKKTDDEAFYFGKWKIDQLIKNGKIVDQRQWETDSTAWNNVYIELIGKLAFSANPNYYDYSKNRAVIYRYQVNQNNFFLTRHVKDMPEDSATVTIHRLGHDKLQWNTILRGDTLQMRLLRDTTKNVIPGIDLR